MLVSGAMPSFATLRRACRRAFTTSTVQVTPVNDAPVAADDAYSTTWNTALIITAAGSMQLLPCFTYSFC